MRNIEIKILVSEESSISTVAQAMSVLTDILEKYEYRRISVAPTLSLSELRTELENTYDCSVRESVHGGCYGARTGTIDKGLTVWLHPKHLIDRCVDEDGVEYVNPWHLLEEYGTLLEDVQGEHITEFAENMGLKVKRDNTYNFNGHSSEDASFMFDFVFDFIENEEDPEADVYMIVEFHCGGDIRGNYTDTMVWKFDSVDEAHSVLIPYKILTDEE